MRLSSPEPTSSYGWGTTAWVYARKWNNLRKNDGACESDTYGEIHERERKEKIKEDVTPVVSHAFLSLLPNFISS